MGKGARPEASQLQKALDFQIQAVQTSRRTYGDLHTSTIQLVGEMQATVQRIRKLAARRGSDMGFSAQQLTEMRSLFRGLYDAAILEKGIQDKLSRHFGNSLAEALLMEGNEAAAEELHREMLRLNTERSGREDKFTLLSISNLAGVLYQQHKYKEALSLTREEVALRRRINGPDDLELVGSFKRLALVLRAVSQLDEEADARREVLRICRKVKGSKDTETTSAAWYLVELLVHTGQQEEAAEILEADLLWLGTADPSELTATQRGILEEINAVIPLREIGVLSREAESGLAAAERDVFFQLFHLVRTGTGSEQGVSFAHYRPYGQAYRDLVLLTIFPNDKGQAVGVRLNLHREFIDSAKLGGYAGEIAKSFLAFACGEEIEQVRDLAAEILHRPTYKAQNETGDLTPQLPFTPSPGYLVFVGQQESFEQVLGTRKLWMQNGVMDGVDYLSIMILPA
jgi:hypothetical protein